MLINANELENLQQGKGSSAGFNSVNGTLNSAKTKLSDALVKFQNMKKFIKTKGIKPA